MSIVEFKRWNKDGWTEIADLEDDFDRGVRKLYARKIDGVWHYAIVHWYHQTSTAVVEFANGRLKTNERETELAGTAEDYRRT